MDYNGSAIIAMKGKGCVAIAADRRFGVQALTLGTNFQKVFPVSDRLYYGLAGLATDRFRMKVNLYNLKEEREISPRTFASVVSSTLYERRFGPYFSEPVIAGLQPDGEPFILLDGSNWRYLASSIKMYGMCESLWEPELEPEELFETISQALLNAVDRDAISGWGAIVHVITPDTVITRTLKGRMD
ncbi:proteasome beta 3 subunit-like protein [Chytridium lagenaria]|nr:proteasome beta 3 subunit-like protein [Chytridium lagenaria]